VIARQSQTAAGGLRFRDGWFFRRGRQLGLARTKEKPWSEIEVDLLERWGRLTDAVIQRKFAAAGYSRSVNGIHLKLKRLRIRQNLDGYSAYSLAESFGVDSHKIGS
jgi:hypothetical protein